VTTFGANSRLVADTLEAYGTTSAISFEGGATKRLSLPMPPQRVATAQDQSGYRRRTANFIPRQNPFYVALPYNDIDDHHTKPEAGRSLPVAPHPASRRRSSFSYGQPMLCPMGTSTPLLVRTLKRTKRTVPSLHGFQGRQTGDGSPTLCSKIGKIHSHALR